MLPEPASPPSYVYILSNPAMPTLYKIGVATDVEERRYHLSKQTNIPDDFYIEAIYPNQSGKLESNLHDRFYNYRYRRDREYFEVDLDFLRHQIAIFLTEKDGTYLYAECEETKRIVGECQFRHPVICASLRAQLSKMMPDVRSRDRINRTTLCMTDDLIHEIEILTEILTAEYNVKLSTQLFNVKLSRRNIYSQIYLDIFSECHLLHFGSSIWIGYPCGDDMTDLFCSDEKIPAYKTGLQLAAEQVWASEKEIIRSVRGAPVSG